MSSSWRKNTALSLMLFQNAAFVLVMSASRQAQHDRAAHNTYNVSIVVVLQELFKLLFCAAAILHAEADLAAPLRTLANKAELARMAVPAACFVLQNNILYVALSNLEPLNFKILYQVKTLLTALMSVIMLGRVFSSWQWISQLLLTVGIVLVQISDSSTGFSAKGSELRNPLLGLAAVLTAATSSSFASVYFEKILKAVATDPSANTSLWHRNVQLCAWTVPMNFALAVLQSSLEKPLTDPLRGFEPSTWAIIVVNGFGGLIVAAVIKYADNVWKGFATAGAIVLTGILAPLLGLGPPPRPLLLLGGFLVVISLIMYAMTPLQAKRGNQLAAALPLGARSGQDDDR